VNKSLRKKLNNELDMLVPELSQSVKDAPISVTEQVKTKKSGIKEIFKKLLPTKKAWATFSTALACFLAVLVAIPFMIPKTDGTVVVLEIKPSVRILSTDGDKVTGVISNNEDGDVLLSDEAFLDSLTGKSLQDAINLISHKAVEYGYIKDGTGLNKINLSVFKEKGEKADKNADKLETGLIAFLCDNGIYALVDGVSIDKTEYQTKFNETITSVKDAINNLKDKSPITTNNQIFDGIDIGIEYLARLQSFIADLKDRFGDIEEMYTDLLSISILYEPFKELSVDAFDKNADVSILLKGLHEEFISKVEEFNAKYGETLNKERFLDLLDLRTAFEEVKTIPTTMEEFKAQVNAMLKNRADFMKDKAKEFFNKNKPKVSMDEYNEYVTAHKNNS